MIGVRIAALLLAWGVTVAAAVSGEEGRNVLGGEVETTRKTRLWVSDLSEILRDGNSVVIKDRRHEQRRERHSGGCIVQLDDRSLHYDGLEAFEEGQRDLPYWTASRIINRGYARRHGYRYVMSSGEKFHDERRLAPAWKKIRLLQEQLQCCCKWAFFLDSDAYFRMDEHSLSVESWLSELTSKDYFKWLEADYGVDLENQTWFPQDPRKLLQPPDSDDDVIGLFPRNGDSEEGACAGKFPEGVVEFFPDQGSETCELGFINTGVFLLRNSTATHKFLDEWYNDPSGKFDIARPWEQGRLNAIASRYKEQIALVPMKELAGHHGRRVRHYWSGEGTERERLRKLQQALTAYIAMAENYGELS